MSTGVFLQRNEIVNNLLWEMFFLVMWFTAVSIEKIWSKLLLLVKTDVIMNMWHEPPHVYVYKPRKVVAEKQLLFMTDFFTFKPCGVVIWQEMKSVPGCKCGQFAKELSTFANFGLKVNWTQIVFSKCRTVESNK